MIGVKVLVGEAPMYLWGYLPQASGAGSPTVLVGVALTLPHVPEFQSVHRRRCCCNEWCTHRSAGAMEPAAVVEIGMAVPLTSNVVRFQELIVIITRRPGSKNPDPVLAKRTVIAVAGLHTVAAPHTGYR